jgi:uncharacterized protein
MIFWDTSALLRCYEPAGVGHSRARNFLLREKHLACSLIRVEAVSAVVRRFGRDQRNARALVKTIEEHLRSFTLVPVSEDLMERAGEIVWKHRLRAADAIHVAAARTLARELGRTRFRVATADGGQAAAARAEGLKVLEFEA